MNFDQLRQHAVQLRKIAQSHGISQIYVFGSVARGETTPSSDVDFLVDMQEGGLLFGVAGFGYESEKLLGIRVDVVPSVTLPQIKDRKFVATVQKEAILL